MISARRSVSLPINVDPAVQFFHFSQKSYITYLKVTSPGFVAVEGVSVRELLLLLPVKRQKVKGIGPCPLEVLIRSREQEPARTTDRTAITTCLGHDLNARLEELQSLCGCDIKA